MVSVQQEILTILRDLAVRGGGYARWGVRGWARSQDIGARLGRAVPGILPSLFRLGMVDRADADHPGRERALLWLYRINSEGARRLAAVEGKPPPLLPPLGLQVHEGETTPIYLPPECVDVLVALREALYDPAAPVHVPGERGWLLTAEIRAHNERQVSGRRFFSEHQQLLLRTGMVERRKTGRVGGKRPRTLYRVTLAGRHAAVLDWREPR